MTQPNDEPVLSDPFVKCGRQGHPGFYVHECRPQCQSVSLYSKERCDKDSDHTDFHWRVTSAGVEVWDYNRGKA